jgi:hypothetical protein
MKLKKIIPAIGLLFLAWTPRPAAANPRSTAAVQTTPQDSTFILPLKPSDRIIFNILNINLTIKRSASTKAQLVVSTPQDSWQGHLKVRMQQESGGVRVDFGPQTNEKGYNDISEVVRSTKATLEIPDGHPLTLSSSFATVEIVPDLEKANIVLNNGVLIAGDIHRLELTAHFSKVHIGNSDQASITSGNSTIKTGNYNTLELQSNFSNITLPTVNSLDFNSGNDTYSITDLGEAKGHKTFGSMQIGKLRKGFSLLGQNTDIAFEEISATVDTVRIDNHFSKVHLPVKGISNFRVRFEGAFSKVIADFQRNSGPDENNYNNKLQFTARVGPDQGKGPIFDVHCDNCEVWFK